MPTSIDEMYGRRTRVIDYEKLDQERQDAREGEPKPHFKGSPSQERKYVSDNEFTMLRQSIADAMEFPELQSIDDYIEWLCTSDEEDLVFDVITLQALARNVFGIEPPDPDSDYNPPELRDAIRAIKDTLINDYGLQQAERAKINHARRGTRSNPHGRHPFADSGGGGSGMGTGRGGPIGFGIGGGPGSMGSKTPWDANDAKNLPMGSRKR